MQKTQFNEDTVSLLQECSSGCKMAIESMEQIKSLVDDKNLQEIITKYNTDHIKIHEKCHLLLNDAGEGDKDPNLMAKMMSKMQTDMKMTSNGSAKEAADILTKGCNMGMKTLAEYMNQFRSASDEAQNLCEKLYQLEDCMVDELRVFL